MSTTEVPVVTEQPAPVVETKEPEKPVSKGERKRQEAERKEAERQIEIRAAVERATAKIKAVLDDEGLMFDWGVRIDVASDGTLRAHKSPLTLAPDPKVW